MDEDQNELGGKVGKKNKVDLHTRGSFNNFAVATTTNILHSWTISKKKHAFARAHSFITAEQTTKATLF
jgi:hypothetical protein